jgi:phage gpG-like protein
MVKSYVKINDEIFKKKMAKAQKAVDDLRVPLILISKDFYKSQQAIFKLKGPGQYPDLKEKTKIDKLRNGYSVYPILYRTGRLAKSTLDASHPDAINQIIDKKILVIGTRVPYGVYHQSDAPRRKIPLRKFLFIGPEAKEFATSDQMGRLKRWTSILDSYVKKAVKK